MSDSWNTVNVKTPHYRATEDLADDSKYVTALAALGLTADDPTPEYKLYKELKAQGKVWDAEKELWVERVPGKREKAEQLLKSLGYRWNTEGRLWEIPNENL